MEAVWIALLTVAVAAVSTFTLVAEWVGRQRGMKECGVWGFFLGPLGILIVLLLPPSIAWEAQRRRDIEREMARQRKREMARQRNDATEDADFRAWREGQRSEPPLNSA